MRTEGKWLFRILRITFRNESGRMPDSAARMATLPGILFNRLVLGMGLALFFGHSVVGLGVVGEDAWPIETEEVGESEGDDVCPKGFLFKG